jgi:hypothetical protein
MVDSPKMEVCKSADIAVPGDDSAGEVGCFHPITASIVAQESFYIQVFSHRNSYIAPRRYQEDGIALHRLEQPTEPVPQSQHTPSGSQVCCAAL